MLCVMNVAVLSRHTLMRYETDGGPELVEPRSLPPAPAPLLSSIHGNLGTAAARCRVPAVELETKVKRRFVKISKSRRRHLLGPFTFKTLLRHYAKQTLS